MRLKEIVDKLLLDQEVPEKDLFFLKHHLLNEDSLEQFERLFRSGKKFPKSASKHMYNPISITNFKKYIDEFEQSIFSPALSDLRILKTGILRNNRLPMEYRSVVGFGIHLYDKDLPFISKDLVIGILNVQIRHPEKEISTNVFNVLNEGIRSNKISPEVLSEMITLLSNSKIADHYKQRTLQNILEHFDTHAKTLPPENLQEMVEMADDLKKETESFYQSNGHHMTKLKLERLKTLFFDIRSRAQKELKSRPDLKSRVIYMQI